MNENLQVDTSSEYRQHILHLIDMSFEKVNSMCDQENFDEALVKLGETKRLLLYLREDEDIEALRSDWTKLELVIYQKLEKPPQVVLAEQEQEQVLGRIKDTLGHAYVLIKDMQLDHALRGLQSIKPLFVKLWGNKAALQFQYNANALELAIIQTIRKVPLNLRKSLILPFPDLVGTKSTHQASSSSSFFSQQPSRDVGLGGQAPSGTASETLGFNTGR